MYSLCNYVGNQLTKLFLQLQIAMSKAVNLACMPQGAGRPLLGSPAAGGAQSVLSTCLRKGASSWPGSEGRRAGLSTPEKTCYCCLDQHTGASTKGTRGKGWNLCCYRNHRVSLSSTARGLTQPQCEPRDFGRSTWSGAPEPLSVDCCSLLNL